LAKFVPNVLTADVLRRMNVPTEKFNASFDAMMRAGKDRLLSLQRSSGGWGWFENDGEDPFMTACAVHGLSECTRLGFPLDSVALKRGRDRLRAMAAEETDLDRLAFEVHVLGEGADRLLPESAKLSNFAHALLTLALAKAGRPEAADVAKALVLRAKDDHWETTSWYYKWDDVSIETTAYAIQALAKVSPKSPLIPKAAAWLLAQRQGSHWRSTKDTAVAIATLLQVSDLEAVAGAVRVEGGGEKRPEVLKSVGLVLNGGERHDLQIDLNNPLKGVFEAHFPRVNPGPNMLSFEKPDDAADFMFRIELAQRRLVERLDSELRGLSVNVTYDKPLEGLRVGDEVTATVVVAAGEAADYVMVQAPIPAGGEVIRGSGSGEFARFEERYDRAIFFLRSLNGKPARLQYRIRCSFGGRFLVLPARAAMMYNEEVYGTGEARSASIQP
jgi:uncharacterized protein YfaS (alpha-2-macroglobulin family)